LSGTAVKLLMGTTCQLYSTILLVSSSTTRSNLPIWSVPVPA
jgi:hypothetical protein